MSDGTQPDFDLTLEELAEEFSRFREDARTRAQRSEAEIGALRGQIERLTDRRQVPPNPRRGRAAQGPPAGAASDPAGVDDPADLAEADEADEDRSMSRRGALLALGGAAAGGVGVALGSAFLAAEPAGATNPSLILDQNNPATAETTVTGGVLSSPLFTVNNNPGSTDAGTGVRGVAAGGSGLSPGSVPTGVWGDTGTGYGVFGSSAGTSGVVGQTTADGQNGVYGIDSSKGGGTAVSGVSDAGIGLHGITAGTSGLPPIEAAAVVGETNVVNGYGVYGSSKAGDGVVGQTMDGGSSGIYGINDTVGGTAITAVAPNGVGLYGVSQGGIAGVYAFNSGGPSLLLFPTLAALPSPATPGHFVVLTDGSLHFCYAPDTWVAVAPNVVGIGNAAGVGVEAHVGVEAQNTSGPQLRLDPGPAALPPTSTPGDFVVLADNSLHYAYGPNEWVALTNGTFPIPPVRVINTTTGTGGITGPLVPGTTVHTSAAIAGTHGIPAAAVGVVGNLAISGVGGALLNGLGFATIFPAGEPTPATANINAGAGCFAISNAVTVGLGAGGANAGKLSLVWGGGGAVPNAEAYFDVTGYIL